MKSYMVLQYNKPFDIICKWKGAFEKYRFHGFSGKRGGAIYSNILVYRCLPRFLINVRICTLNQIRVNPYFRNSSKGIL